MSGCEARLRRRQPSPPEARWSAMKREWQVGDVAMVTWTPTGRDEPTFVERGISMRDGMWMTAGEGGYEIAHKHNVTDVRPLIVIDPEASDLYIQSDGRDMTVWHDDKPLLTEHQAGPILWAHLVATLPTRDEPQPEPLDPGVRVRDKDGREWARSTTNGVWMSALVFAATWADLLHDRRPLTIVTPAPEPTPDERPFKVGDAVKVADDALSGTTESPSTLRGRVCEYAGESDFQAGYSLVAEFGTPLFKYLVHPRFLSHADAPC